MTPGLHYYHFYLVTMLWVAAVMNSTY